MNHPLVLTEGTGAVDDPVSQQTNKASAVFGIVVDGVLLYGTLRPNPARAMRCYKKLGRPEGEVPRLFQFSMKRQREAGDVRGLSREAMVAREGYIGPMR